MKVFHRTLSLVQAFPPASKPLVPSQKPLKEVLRYGVMPVPLFEYML